MTSRTLAAALAAGVFSIAILGGTVSPDPQQKPATASGTSSPTARAGVDDEPWPRTITSGDTTVTIYQPQIDAFDGFTTKATAAVSVARTGRDAQVFGVVSVTGRTLIDKVARLVTGNGEGRMAVGTKISRSKDGKTIELENYGISPVALKNIAIAKQA